MTFQEFLRYLFLLIFFPRSLKTMEWRMLRLLNKDRKYHCLPPVRMQEDLREVARKHSRDMAQKDYFAHVNLKAQSPSDRLKLGGVSEVVSGENLAKIGGFAHPTQTAEVGLMNSPGHRANILNPLYNTVGIGVVQSSTKIYYFTQNFAKRDLIFYKKIPKILRYRQKLHLHGEVFNDVATIFYQIIAKDKPYETKEKCILVHKKIFALELVFPQPGLYEIKLYTGKSTDKTFTLANNFEIKVRKSFWQKL